MTTELCEARSELCTNSPRNRLRRPEQPQEDRRSGSALRRWRIPLFVIMPVTGICCVVLLAQSGAHEPVYGEAATIFGSALASSVAGFAFSALSGAILFRDGTTPLHVVEIMIVSSIAIQLISVAALWRSIRWKMMLPYVGGGAAGLPIGLFLLFHVPTSSYVRDMGIFLFCYGMYLLSRRPCVVRVNGWAAALLDAAAGFLGGVTGGAAGFPGACVTIWCAHRGWDKLRQRAVTQPFILIMQIATIAALGATGPARPDHARLDASAFAFVPIALCGTYLGLRAFYQLSDRGFARFLALLLAISALGLIGVR